MNVVSIVLPPPTVLLDGVCLCCQRFIYYVRLLKWTMRHYKISSFCFPLKTEWRSDSPVDAANASPSLIIFSFHFGCFEEGSIRTVHTAWILIFLSYDTVYQMWHGTVVHYETCIHEPIVRPHFRLESFTDQFQMVMSITLIVGLISDCGVATRRPI